MKYISSIPKIAIKSLPKSESHSHTSYNFTLHDKKVGWQLFNEQEVLVWEKAFKNDKMHGFEYYFFDHNGQVSYVCPYENGLIHGTVQQFSPNGKLIHETVFHHGTGADLWYDFDENGVPHLSEERHFINGQREGVERWYNENGTTIWRELYFHKADYHGIEREWDENGKLEKGFPKFFIQGKEVDKMTYIEASENDETLVNF